ncbi:poly(ADP-ribose) glycohydrolase 1-like protein isoform X1, partial [Tanacetum coccineum]
SGLIEDQSKEALEVDFANEYFGGGALSRGYVQEEIRFMINPELIAGMLFLPCMADNEAIEVVGAERFSNYTGYASTFRFCGDVLDTKYSDIMGRCKTRIIAMDALSRPGKRQYGHDLLLREVNKAFCGFSDPCKSHRYEILLNGETLNQWLAASQVNETITYVLLSYSFFASNSTIRSIHALRPFVVYYTFGLEALQSLDQSITSNGWSVGDLWNTIAEYSSQRSKKKKVGFFNWLLPRLYSDNPMISDP